MSSFNLNHVLSVNDLSKSFDRKSVLRGGTLSANKGEIVCIVGENGSGIIIVGLVIVLLIR